MNFDSMSTLRSYYDINIINTHLNYASHRTIIISLSLFAKKDKLVDL